MKRETLLESREYWMVRLQNDLYGVIEEYMASKELNRTKLAEKIGVTKGYITQLLNGNFDHKISKLVDLSLAIRKVPILNYVDLDAFIENDRKKINYELITCGIPKPLTFTAQANNPSQKDPLKVRTNANI